MRYVIIREFEDVKELMEVCENYEIAQQTLLSSRLQGCQDEVIYLASIKNIDLKLFIKKKDKTVKSESGGMITWIKDPEDEDVNI